jgi:hypothetical protein
VRSVKCPIVSSLLISFFDLLLLTGLVQRSPQAALSDGMESALCDEPGLYHSDEFIAFS